MKSAAFVGMAALFLIGLAGCVNVQGGKGKDTGKLEKSAAAKAQHSSGAPADSMCRTDADCHAQVLASEMDALINHLRKDAKEVSDPRARALFETSAETVLGLKKSLDDYRIRIEPG